MGKYDYIASRTDLTPTQKIDAVLQAKKDEEVQKREDEYADSAAYQKTLIKPNVSTVTFKPDYAYWVDQATGEIHETNDWGSIPDKRWVVNANGQYLAGYVNLLGDDNNRGETWQERGNNLQWYGDPNHVTDVGNVVPAWGSKPGNMEQFVNNARVTQATQNMGKATDYGEFRLFRPGEEMGGQYKVIQELSGGYKFAVDAEAPETGLATWTGRDFAANFGNALQIAGTIVSFASGGTLAPVGIALAAAGGAYNAEQGGKEAWEGALIGAVQGYLAGYGAIGIFAGGLTNKIVYHERDMADITKSSAASAATTFLGGIARGYVAGITNSTMMGSMAYGATAMGSARLQGQDWNQAVITGIVAGGMQQFTSSWAASHPNQYPDYQPARYDTLSGAFKGQIAGTINQVYSGYGKTDKWWGGHLPGTVVKTEREFLGTNMYGFR